MNAIRTAIEQPITVAVGVILILMAGMISLTRIPIQLTPNVDDTIISVTTFWEGASPDEIEKEVIDKQEEQLQSLTNLRTMSSTSSQSTGQITLEFAVGTRKEAALQEVSDKLRQVPSYPQNVDEPVIEASDPRNRDYIAWIMLESDDPNLDIRSLQDFAENRIKPVFERVPGMSEVNVLGGREREVQIRFDPLRLAQHGITPTQLVTAIQQSNRNVSAGELADGKLDVRLRTIGQFDTVEAVEATVVTTSSRGSVLVGDVATVVETYKKPNRFVRARGEEVIAINAQREVGSNVIEVMNGLKAEIERMNTPGGLLDTHANQLGLDGTIRLRQVFDQTIYIDDALALVQSNIWIGSTLAIFVLLLFLRSIRSVGIIALAIPISVIGSVVVMVIMGRSINVISLAGMAFAVGMVVDNAIVVLENIFRHLEMGKRPMVAAYEGAREVGGAILASTLTTIAVFVPILLVEEEAGQLFRDIALAICAAIGLSLLVSITVIPTAAGRLLRPINRKKSAGPVNSQQRKVRPLALRVVMFPLTVIVGAIGSIGAIPRVLSNVIYALCGSVLARLAVVLVLTGISVLGSWMLLPPADYLPQGNRNLVFGMLNAPPGYNLDHQSELGARIEQTMRPYWMPGMTDDPQEREEALAAMPEIQTFAYGQPGPRVTPPPIENYFFVGTPGVMFHGAISEDPRRLADVIALFQHATQQDVIPGILAFAFQVPLFRLGGSTGSAVQIDFVGDDLDAVINAADAAYGQLVSKYGPWTVQPQPMNFNIPGPEMQVIPNRLRLSEFGMSIADLGTAVRASGDGAIIGEYRIGGESIDLKLIAKQAVNSTSLVGLDDIPIASPTGHIVPLSSLATLQRVTSPQEINRVGRQRAVSLQFTAPDGIPLEQAIDDIDEMLATLSAQGAIPPHIGVNVAGSASKLQAVREALLGDGTFIGTLGSSLILALIIVYLLMCVLFQSFLYPFVIMFSVPLATLGGFAALAGVHAWSEMDRYMPVQNLDVLTMLGFVILIGVVVNNAILLVHQSLNFMRGVGDAGLGIDGPLPARRAIAESVRTRVRPIFMSMLTSVGAMLPLVLMPGSGSELYRGLGSVVVGGLIVSAAFTLILVPLLFSLVLDIAHRTKLVTKPTVESETAAGAAGGPQPAFNRSPDR
jgi:HAE1 family hydrophobic/amphiphilic exporter-1